MRTIRFARVAAAASVPNQPMAEQRPLALRHERHQLLLDLFCIRLFGQAETIRKARYVRVHDDTDIDIISVSEHNVRCLAAHAAKVGQILHSLRNLAAVFFDQRRAAGFDVLRLVSIEAGGLYLFFQVFDLSVRIIRGSAIVFEQLGSNDVYTFVRALSGKDGGDEQFERVGKIQLAMRIRISFLQSRNDFFDTGGFGFGSFSWHASNAWTRRHAKRRRFKFHIRVNFSERDSDFQGGQIELRLRPCGLVQLPPPMITINKLLNARFLLAH